MINSTTKLNLLPKIKKLKIKNYHIIRRNAIFFCLSDIFTLKQLITNTLQQQKHLKLISNQLKVRQILLSKIRDNIFD